MLWKALEFQNSPIKNNPEMFAALTCLFQKLYFRSKCQKQRNSPFITIYTLRFSLPLILGCILLMQILPKKHDKRMFNQYMI